MEILICEDSKNELWNAGMLKLVTTDMWFYPGCVLFREAEINTERITNIRNRQLFLNSLVSKRGWCIKLHGWKLYIYRASALINIQVKGVVNAKPSVIYPAQGSARASPDSRQLCCSSGDISAFRQTLI